MSKQRFPSKIISPVNQSVFKRQRLLDILVENKHKPLVWVHGSPGAGKTTLISSWLKQQKSQFLWYRMDTGNNTSADLFYYLTLSAQRNYPRKRFKLPVFTAEYTDDIKAFAVVFFRQLFAVLEKETVIVFDNCQEIENDPDFFDILQIALNDIPERLQFICISRNRLANFFSRLSLTGDLLDINPDLLRFTEVESVAFISWLNPDIDKQTSAVLQEKAKGWAVALVLLSHIQKPNNIQAQTPVLNGQQSVFSFLMAEVLAKMDKVSLQFLAKTAIFDQFTVTMAIALTGFQNARDFLDQLVNKNFLIDRTDEIHPIYSFHPILQNLLKNQNKSLLTKEKLNELNRKAIIILIEQEHSEEAIPFYLQLQDWTGLKPLLLIHSESLINNGRHHVVIKWMQHLPDEMLNNDSWLLYWYASAIKSLDSNRAAELLDKCYRQFLTNNDRLGLYSTWQLAVEAITISLDDNTRLDIWFQRFDELHEQFPHCPSFELKIKFSVIAIQALAFYNPQHPWLQKLVKISEYGFRVIPIKSIQHRVSSQLGHYYLMVNEICKLQVVKPYLLSAIDDEKLPLFPRSMNAFSVGFLNLYQGNGDAGLTYFAKALEISEQAAIPLLKSKFKLHQVGCHICRGDLVNAQNTLDNCFSEINPKQRVVLSLFHFYTAWMCALKGQFTLALKQNEQSLLLNQRISNDVGTVCCLGLQAKLLATTEQWEAAEKTCSLLADFGQQSPNKHYQLEYHLSSAWLGLLLNDKKRALSGIQEFLTVANGEQVKFFCGWQPEVISPLCILAIEHQIEVEFAISMMQLNTLCPQPPQHLEQWPWPVRIYCFNHLQIELDGHRLKQDGKSQKKVIELLLTIISLGSQEVKSEQVSDWLWPDSDGDLAKQTLETALFRLRKLIGKSTVLVKDGQISLNLRHCWIDVQVFETTLKELEDVLQNKTDDTILIQLSNRLFHLYQGSFLQQFDYDVVKSKEKQLQVKFTHLIERLVVYYEKQQNHKQIRNLLEQSLNRIPQFESEHQELISFYQKIT